MNLIFTVILFFITNAFHLDELCNNTLIIDFQRNISHEYIPLRYILSKTFLITNPCHTQNSILIRNNTLYKFDYEWKRLCISRTIFTQQPIVNSIAYLNNDLILIINGVLFRTQDIISSAQNKDIIYRLIRYSNLPIDKIDYVFTTPCCNCHGNIHLISNAFNDYVILANKDGYVILFSLKSLTSIYNFGDIFQLLTICQSNQCDIIYLGFSHSQPTLICFIKYENQKVIIYHHSFLIFNSTYSKSTFINFTGDNLFITPTSIPDSYFIWDEKTLFYTSNNGFTISEVIPLGCDFDSMDEHELKHYYKNLDLEYDNLTLLTKQIYCLNQPIDSVYLSNKEFFILTKSHQWYYGKENFHPSIINLEKCNLTENDYIPKLNQCLMRYCLYYCSFIRFEPLFDINQIYLVEKNDKKSWKFIFETYKILPIIVSSSTKRKMYNYSVDYDIKRLNNGIIQIFGNIHISIINDDDDDEDLGSSLISIRVELIDDNYSCDQSSSFTFQIEISCSSKSSLRVERDNQSNSIIDIEWIRENLPINIIHQFSSVYIKCKQTDSISLNYQYCFNQTCQSIDDNQHNSFLIYAIPTNKNHETYAHYLINQTDSCIQLSPSIYHLWLKWTMNMTERQDLFKVPFERRTFYRTLLNMLSISNNSCLFSNGSKFLYINKTINQAQDDHMKFLLHIISLKNKYSFCDLETFVLIDIELIHNIPNSYRGLVFLITLVIFFLVFILFIYIYTYYKHKQRNKYLQYQRLNQIDSGQFHQWYDIARYLNENKYTDEYDFIRDYFIKNRT